uniref:Uncharacterized protein n=1 Tax=Romanomermis culicivorax TaxID=13658 RepID=A0A915J1Z5_ROMCU
MQRSDYWLISNLKKQRSFSYQFATLEDISIHLPEIDKQNNRLIFGSLETTNVASIYNRKDWYFTMKIKHSNDKLSTPNKMSAAIWVIIDNFTAEGMQRNGTERNVIHTTLLNQREIFVPFRSVGGYRQSFSTTLHLRSKVNFQAEPFKLLAISSVPFHGKRQH